MEENTIFNSKLVTLGNLGVFWENIKTKITDVDNKIGARSEKDGDNVIKQATGIYIDIENIEDSILSLTGGVGSVSTQIQDAINKLDVTDTAEDGQYVSSVSQVDGKISVTRENLPVYTLEGLGGITPAAVDTKIATATENMATKTELSALENGKVKDNADAIAVLNGDGEGSVAKAITDAFNDFSTKVSDDKVVNTYKELIDYAAEHGSEFTELVGVVGDKASKTELSTAVSTLEGEISTAESNAKAYTDDELAKITLATDAEINALFA